MLSVTLGWGSKLPLPIHPGLACLSHSPLTPLTLLTHSLAGGLRAGTTFSYFPTRAFNALVAELDAQVKPRLQRTPGPDPQYDDVCYKGASSNGDQLGEVFPTFKVRDHQRVLYCTVHTGTQRTVNHSQAARFPRCVLCVLCVCWR